MIVVLLERFLWDGMLVGRFGTQTRVAEVRIFQYVSFSRKTNSLFRKNNLPMLKNYFLLQKNCFVLYSKMKKLTDMGNPNWDPKSTLERVPVHPG